MNSEFQDHQTKLKVVAHKLATERLRETSAEAIKDDREVSDLTGEDFLLVLDLIQNHSIVGITVPQNF